MSNVLPKSSRKKVDVPFFIIASLGGIAASLLFAAFQHNTTFQMAFSNSILFISFLFLGASWLLYLKKDGVRFFQPRKKNPLNKSASWLDRIGAPGEIPHAPYTIPDASGPESEAYQQLTEAEQKLKHRLFGSDRQTAEPDSSLKTRTSLRMSLLAGCVLLIIGLAVQYLL